MANKQHNTKGKRLEREEREGKVYDLLLCYESLCHFVHDSYGATDKVYFILENLNQQLRHVVHEMETFSHD